MSQKKNIAVFLDRDGTIIEDRGHLKCTSDVVLFPETVEALRKLQKHFLLFIVTNQPGVAKGLICRNDVDNVNRYLINMLAEAGIEITDVYVCPHNHSDDCVCIKPKSYFLQKAADDYNINLKRSFVIGDHPHDIELAMNAGSRGIYVLTGHGSKHMAELPEGTEAAISIMQAAEKIMLYSQVKKSRSKTV